MSAMIGFNLDSGAPLVGARKSNALRPHFLLAGAVVLLLAGGVYGIVNLVLSPPSPRMKQVIHEISLLPPPPPQIEQPPPEVKEEVMIPEPQPVSQEDAIPPGDLGLDADGNGSDGFQLRARKGARGLLEGGAFSAFANHIQESVYKILTANKKVRDANYVVTVRLWLGQDGRIERYELANSTGNAEVDSSIKVALAQIGSLGNEMPPGLPQPVKLQIVSRQ
jgi:periplasmic protein TonB